MNMKKTSFRVAFCGIVTALGIVFMLLSTIIPVFTYASPIWASILLLPVITEIGKKEAMMTWAATSILALILLTDKEAAFFYIFIGCYPVIRTMLQKIKLKPIRILVKILYLTAVISAMYAILIYILQLQKVVAEFAEHSLMFNISSILILVFVMMVLDSSMDNLTKLYIYKIKPKLKIK